MNGEGSMLPTPAASPQPTGIPAPVALVPVLPSGSGEARGPWSTYGPTGVGEVATAMQLTLNWALSPT